MHRIRYCLSASILLAVGSAGIQAEDPPASALSRAEFARLSRDMNLKSQPWASIPWKVSVTEARQLAAREGKPIFLVVNTGNCLGWT